MTPNEQQNLYQIVRNIRYRYQLDQFEDDALKEIQKPVDQARKEIMVAIDDAYDDPAHRGAIWTNERNEELLEELTDLTTGIKAQLGEDITEVAGIAYENSIAAHNSIMSIGGRAVNVAMVQLAGEQIASFLAEPTGGMLLNDWVQRTFDHPLQEKLRQEMQAGLFRGESYRKLSKRINELLGEAADNTDTLVRTWVQSANVAAQRRVMDANADLIKGWSWNATLENGDFGRGTGTCIRCLALDCDDTVYPIDGGPRIPLHPRCRCLRMMQTKSYREIGIPIDDLDDAVRPYTIRGKIDPLTGKIKRGETGIGGQPLIDAGRIDGGMDEFFGELSDQLQRDTLGPGRYQLWKDGKIKLGDLADGQGRQLTIKELTGGKTKVKKSPAKLDAERFKVDFDTKKAAFETSMQQYIKGSASKERIHNWYKQGTFPRFAFLSHLEANARSDLVEDFNAIKQAEYRLADAIPEEEFREWKREKIQAITNFNIQISKKGKEDLFKNMDKGFEWVSYDLLDEMADEKFKINVVKKADLYQGKRAYYDNAENVFIDKKDNYITIAHEWGHAVDDYFSYAVKDFGSDTAIKKYHGSGLNWKGNDYVTSAEAENLRDYYLSFTTGKKRKYANGDGYFWEDNWLDDYEGRIYDKDSVGEEWWSMNIQRYGDYRVKSSDPFYYESHKTRAERELKDQQAMLDRQKQTWHKTKERFEKAKPGTSRYANLEADLKINEKAVKRGEKGIEIMGEALQQLKDQGQDSWARESTSWSAATRRYPDLAQFIENKFGSKIMKERWQ